MNQARPNSRNFIGGHWTKGSGNELLSMNPANGQPLWRGHQSTSRDVSEAVTAARAALPQWSAMPQNTRVEYLLRFQQAVERHAEELAEVISDEVGKPLWEARTEVQAMVGKVPVSIDAAQQRRSEQSIQAADHLQVTRYKPHGVMAVFGPFNFPGHISNGHIVPALLTGNTVVFKPSELTPLVAERMVAFWQESGLPDGVINLVQGSRETGESLVAHRGIHGVLFTGSLRTGLAISQQLANRPEILLALELGGNNPLIVHDVADLTGAVYAAIQSAFLTGGQRCTCTRRLIVPRGLDTNEDFIHRLVEATKCLRIDLPRAEPPPFFGPLVQTAAVDRVLAEQQRLRDSQATSLVAAKRLDLGPAFVSPGIVDVTGVDDLDDEEVFGPLLQLIRVADIDEAIQVANKTQYGLVAGVFSQDRDLYERVFHEVDAGLFNWNRPTTGASGKLPFGGVGRSGNHRPAGYFMVDACNIPVGCLESPTLPAPEKRLPGT